MKSHRRGKSEGFRIVEVGIVIKMLSGNLLRRNMNKYEQFYINGEWVDPVNKLKTLDVINPATEDVIGTIAMGDSDDVDSAVKAAKNAFERFGQTTTEE